MPDPPSAPRKHYHAVEHALTMTERSRQVVPTEIEPPLLLSGLFEDDKARPFRGTGEPRDDPKD